MGCSASHKFESDYEKTKRLHLFVDQEINNGKLHKNVFVYRNLYSFASQYSMKDEIGHGAFGKIFLVKHLKTGETRCCKMIKNKSAELDDLFSSRRTSISRRFHQIDYTDDSILDEIKILSILDHPNIIKIYEYFISGGSFYLILEHVEGMDLQRFLSAEKKLSPQKVFKILKQVLYVLSYIHSMRIVHRDIKAENIMITKDNKIKLIDFGSASYLPSRTLLNRKVGSLSYWPPEVLKNGYNYGCDIWSLGILALLLLKGKFPAVLRGNENQIELNIMKLSSCNELIESDDVGSLSPIINDLLTINFRKRETAHSLYSKYFFSKVVDADIKLPFQSKHKLNHKCKLIKKVSSQLVLNQSEFLTKYSSKVKELNKLFKANDTNAEGTVTIGSLKKIRFSDFLELMLTEEIALYLKDTYKLRACMYIFLDIFNKQGYTLNDLLSICKLKATNCIYQLDNIDLDAKYTKEDHVKYFLSMLQDLKKEGSCQDC